MNNSAEIFETFLKNIDLDNYREKYRPIKLVEMDLPKEIQAISLLYQIYWEQENFIDYDKFYAEYLSTYNIEIENFRLKITMCKDCFYRGLPARIYRTWASIITQIHAGYVAEAVFGDGSVAMSAELDHNGADFQVQYRGQTLNYQVKKKSFSREIRTSKIPGKTINGQFIDIKYEVPQAIVFENPKRNDGTFRAPYLRFINNDELKRLPNGFIVFTRKVFERKKNQLDNI